MSDLHATVTGTIAPVVGRYYVERRRLRWHVHCGTGTRTLFRSLRHRAAARVAYELQTAFLDGVFCSGSSSRRKTLIPMEVKRRVIAADVRIMRLEELLSKWVSYCDQAGVRPVSGDVRDNPVLQLIKDSRAALGKLCEDEGCPHYGKPHEHPERRASQVEREP